MAHRIEIVPCDGGTDTGEYWIWRIAGDSESDDGIYYDDPDAAEQGAIHALGAGEIDGFDYPDS